MSVDQAVTALQDVPTFEGLPDEALRILAISAEELSLGAGEVLFRAGERADDGYVVLTGRLELVSEQTNRRGRLCELLPGALLGETALLVAGVRPAMARALESSRLMRISRTTFLRMLEGFPEAATPLRDVFAARVGETLAALEALRQKRLDGGA